MRTILTILLTAALLMTGCSEDSSVPASDSQRPAQDPVAAAAPTVDDAGTEPKPDPAPAVSHTEIFAEPIDPVTLELPSQALPYWRDLDTTPKPTLALFSIHPLLEPIDPAVAEAATRLVKQGETAAFVEHGSFYRAEPLILPTQALSAALAAEMFAEIVWVFPSTAPVEGLQLDLFRKQLVDAGFLTESEGDQLNLNGGQFTGTVRGVPFKAVHPSALPAVDGPLVLHVDLGYFKGLYQGEVKTRIYDLLHNTALALNETGWSPERVTLSYSTMEGTFSLDVRFLITNFADILRDPSLLDGTMPEAWALRSEALYAVNFFLDSKVQEYYKRAATDYPENAAAQYDLYKHLFFDQREIDAALEVLDRAVALDPGYVAAYLELAEIASNDGNQAAALELLDQAAPLVKENPFVDLHRAQFMLQFERPEQALPLIERLQPLPWSKHFHPEIPGLLTEMKQAAQGSE